MTMIIILFPSRIAPRTNRSGKAQGKLLTFSLSSPAQDSATSTRSPSGGDNTPPQFLTSLCIELTIKLTTEVFNV